MTGFVKSFHLANFIIYFYKTKPHTYPPLKKCQIFHSTRIFVCREGDWQASGGAFVINP